MGIKGKTMNYDGAEPSGILAEFFDTARSTPIQTADLTRPSKWAQGIVCIANCEKCPLALKGCADECTRFDDLVCQGCPCVNHPIKNGVDITFDPYASVISGKKKRPNNRKPRTPPETKLEIAQKYATGKYTRRQLMHEYDLGHSTVDRILTDYKRGIDFFGRRTGPKPKLTSEQRAEILEKYTGKKGEQTALAKEYGVSSSLINSIVN